MKKIAYGGAAAILAMSAAACATPEVVDSRQATDAQLSCAELLSEIDEAEEFRSEAREERGVTGTNVAAAVFFPLGLVGTYMNTEEAIEAAEERIEHLEEIYEEKNCG